MLKYRRSLSRARAGILLAVALTLVLGLSLTTTPARADLPDFPDGYPKMGQSSAAQEGLAVVGAEYGRAMTVVFPLEVGPNETQFAYCVELSVSARYGIDVTVGDWASFPGDNQFASDPTVREKVAWIVYHSFPHLTLAEVQNLLNEPALTEAEAIAGTQAAIWTLTDGFQFDGLNGDSPDAEARVQSVIDHLVGPANVGRAETVGPEVTIQAPADAGQAGQLVGPIRIQASEPVVSVTVTGDHPLVDADNNPVDLAAVPTDTDLFVDVPADAPAGSVSLEASVTGPISTGLLVSNTDPRTQTLMIARSDQTTRTATGAVTWQAQPRITTTATDATDGDDHLDTDGEVTVVDTVTYDGLIPGETYRLAGELMVRGDDGSETATGITAEHQFTPTETSGSVELQFTVPADTLVGEVIVVFEELHHGKVRVAAHTDINDEKQTVHRPRIGTTAADGPTGGKLLPERGEATVVDTVSFSGLKVGQSYTLEGTLMTRAADGEAVDTGITEEVTFQPEASSGTVELTFTIPAGELRGETVVVFERLFLDVTEVASHADIADDGQTVYRPRIGTTAVDGQDGDKHLPSQGEVTVTDTVRYIGLEPGKEYTVHGELMTRDADGEPVATGITASQTFTPSTPSGSVDLTFTIDDGELVGETIVVFESLQRNGTEIAAHADIDDAEQTVHRPEIGTSAVDGEDGDEFLAEHGAATVVDTVTYRGLRVGESYTITGELMVRTADGPEPTGVTAERTFVPETPDGSVDLTFTIGEGELLGSVLVVFERLSIDEVEVAAHTDLSDEAQTVYRPRIDTYAYDLSDGDQQLDPNGGTLRDDVSYWGLKIGQSYVVRGEVMNHTTGETTGITGETRFVAEQSTGIIHVDFTIPDTYATETLVVFEWLYLVADPEAAGASTRPLGDVWPGVVPAEQSMIETITPFSTPGNTQTYGNTQMYGDTGPFRTDLVTDETEPVELLLATHNDLNAERQTVRVADLPPPPPPAAMPPLADTGSGPGLGTGVAAGMLLLACGAGLVVAARRRGRS